MALPRAVRQAFINAAITGKDVNPEQILASVYGRMGGVFGRLQGPTGSFNANISLPKPPEVPKPLQFTISKVLR